MVTNLVTLFCAQLLAIALKVLQQLHVRDERITRGALTSFVMAATDSLLVVTVVNSGWHLATVLTLGAGGAAGMALAVQLHRRLRGTA